MLKVDSINCGIVIDHISQGNGIKIFEKLKLGEVDYPVVLLMNVHSAILGKKDIIKIENRIDLDLTMLGLIDTGLTINIIEDGKRISKEKVKIPEEVSGLFRCKNPRCVTNYDEYAIPKFKLAQSEHVILYSCNYCEELTSYTI